MSRISSTSGTRRINETTTPAQPQKNCGLVAIITCGRRQTSIPAMVAVAMYDRKFNARRRLPLLAAR